MPQIIRYGLAGIINTAVGYAVFLACFYMGNMSAWLANTMSYGVGLLSAYILNRVYVFTNNGAQPDHTNQKGSAYRFVIAFLIAFSLNQLVLHVLHQQWHMPAQWAQLGAMACYTVIFYLLNKWYVFPADNQSLTS